MRVAERILKDPHPLHVLRFADLVKLGLVNNRQTLRKWVIAGKFPAPFQLNENSIGWKAAEVAEWLEGRVAEREALIRRWRGEG